MQGHENWLLGAAWVVIMLLISVLAFFIKSWIGNLEKLLNKISDQNETRDKQLTEQHGEIIAIKDNLTIINKRLDSHGESIRELKDKYIQIQTEHKAFHNVKDINK